MGAETGEFSVEQLEVLTTLNAVFSVLSFLGSSFIIFMFLKVKTLRSFAFQLVFWISVSDVFYSIGNMLADPRQGSDLCYFQAVMIAFWNLTSVLWTTTIAYTLHMTLLKEHMAFNKQQMNDRMKYFHIFCWGVPLILTILPATTNSYGDSGGWCWIADNDDVDRTWRFVQFYIPLWIAVVYNSIIYFKVIAKLKTLEAATRASRPVHVHSVSENDAEIVPEVSSVDRSIAAGVQSQLKTMDRVKYYPAVLVVCYFFATVNRLYEISGDQVFWLTILHTIGASFQGILNCIVYGLTPSVREAFVHLVADSACLSKLCACCALKDDNYTDVDEPQQMEIHETVPVDQA